MGSPIMFLGRHFGIIGRNAMGIIGRSGNSQKNGRRLNFHLARSSYGTFDFHIVFLLWYYTTFASADQEENIFYFCGFFACILFENRVYYKYGCWANGHKLFRRHKMDDLRIIFWLSILAYIALL